MPIKKRVNHQFFSTWSPAMAYVLGFFTADGTLTYTKNGGSYIAFHITDRDLLYAIVAYLIQTIKLPLEYVVPDTSLATVYR